MKEDKIMLREQCNLYIQGNTLYYDQGSVKLADIVEVDVVSLAMSYFAIVLFFAIFGFIVLGGLAMILLAPMLVSGKLVVKTTGGSEITVCSGNMSEMEDIKHTILREVRRVRDGESA